MMHNSKYQNDRFEKYDTSTIMIVKYIVLKI